MDLATSRMINESETNLFDVMSLAEYNEFCCGFYRNMTPSEAEIEYIKDQEAINKIYEKLY